jgi:hypothetical protein
MVTFKFQESQQHSPLAALHEAKHSFYLTFLPGLAHDIHVS